MTETRHSLIDRATRGTRRLPEGLGKIDWPGAAAIWGAIALGPLVTILGAGALERGVRAETAALTARAAPLLKAQVDAAAARALIRGAPGEPTLAVWLDRVASVLPADARIARMAMAANGRVELAISTGDPDRLREALRRDASLRRFREIGQQRAGAMMLVTLQARR